VLERAARHLSVRTAVSAAARDLTATYFPGEFTITPNGVDYERFANALSVRTIDDPPTVLFLSRIEKRKGLNVLIRAIAGISGVGARLIVGGDGPDRSSAERLAAELGIDAQFLGRVDQVDLPGLYRRASVYCAPGLGGESFGIVLIEAMAAGAPVVCSDLPGFRDVAGDVALLVPPRDGDALSTALERVLTDETQQKEMSAASSERARKYDWAKLVVNVEHIYDDALAGAAR
jgi:phosphatidylinositol alpha-mannosyltransferase